MDRSSRRREMAALLARKHREGLSYRGLEEATGVSRHTLAAWGARLARERGTQRDGETPFVELVAAPDDGAPESAIEIVAGPLVVRVRRGFDDDALARVLALVASRC